jgi:hypothetical protein
MLRSCFAALAPDGPEARPGESDQPKKQPDSVGRQLGELANAKNWASGPSRSCRPLKPADRLRTAFKLLHSIIRSLELKETIELLSTAQLLTSLPCRYLSSVGSVDSRKVPRRCLRVRRRPIGVLRADMRRARHT